MTEIQDEFRSIIGHALLGCDTSDVDAETWNLVVSECEKYVLKLKEDIQCKCEAKDRYGETDIACCNNCGLPTEKFWSKK